MDEKKEFKFKLLERTDEKPGEVAEKQTRQGISHTNQTDPIYRNLAKFTNAKIGDKWSIKDLLR